MNSSYTSPALTPAPVGLGGNSNGSVCSRMNDSAVIVEDEQRQNLNLVINSIEKTLALIHQLYLTVSCFNTACQLPLLQRFNGLVLELDNMVKLSEKCNIQVPVEVLGLIDDGKNPDLYTRDIINSCISRNQVTKGKTDAFKSLRKCLLEELDQAFPDEVESFREMRALAAAESKRFQAQNSLPNGDVKMKPDV